MGGVTISRENAKFHEILSGLYIGSRDATETELMNIGVDVIVNMAPVEETPQISQRIEHHRFPITLNMPIEEVRANLLSAIIKVQELIMDGHIVYLHCVEGYNRSAAVAVVVYAKMKRCSWEEAIERINAIRPISPQRHLLLLE